MVKIPRRLKINNYEIIEYDVHTEEEFLKMDKPYKYWKECKEGEWGISDDGYVAECLSVNTYASGVEMTFCYGKQWITKSSKLLFVPHWENKSFHGTSTKSHMELELQKTRTKNLLEAYMAYILAGEKPDFDKLGQMYRPDQEKPAWTVKRLLKTKGMKQMIKEKMKEVLTERGIDEGYVLDTIKDAIIPPAGAAEITQPIVNVDDDQTTQAPPLPNTPMPNRQMAALPSLQKNINTGLTRTESALLSPSEQVIARRT